MDGVLGRVVGMATGGHPPRTPRPPTHPPTPTTPPQSFATVRVADTVGDAVNKGNRSGDKQIYQEV